MEGSSWCPEAVDSSDDWRKQLLPEARQRIVNKIMDTLKRHLPVSAPEGLNELKKIAEGFEEKIYIAAINQSDYLRQISLRMLSTETKTQGAAAIDPSLSSPTIGNQSPSESGIPKMLSMETKTQGAAAIDPSLSNPTIGNQSPSESVYSTTQMGTADAVAVNSTIQAGPADTVAVNSTTQTGHADAVDWQEEVYQEVKSMKELYYAEISELHQKISLKIQQLPQSEALGPPAKQSEQFEKLKQFKLMLERTMLFLQLSKNNIQPNLKDRLPMFEKQIMSFVSSNRNKSVAPSQQQGQPEFPHPSGQ